MRAQDLIRQGLLEAPQPKIKISNMMRVLGAEATADPTAIEQEVRRQVQERAQVRGSVATTVYEMVTLMSSRLAISKENFGVLTSNRSVLRQC